MGAYAKGLTAPLRSGYDSWEADSYRRGQMTPTKVGGFEIWRGFKTPSQIRDEVARINAQVEQTGHDLFTELERRGAFPPDTKDRPGSVLPLLRFFENTWSPFAQEWQVFLVKHGPGSGWTENFWGGAWDSAQDHLKQLQGLRDQAKSSGFKLEDSHDIIEPDPSSIEKAGRDAWSMLKTLFYLGVFIVAGIALVQVVQMIR